jgi:hypothetical protein
MSKQEYIMQGRNEGIVFSVNIINEKGPDELIRIARQRKLAGLKTMIDPRLYERDLEKAKRQMLDTILIMSIIVLKDEFDFGSKRLDRFRKRFNEKSECLETGHVTWIDLIEQIQEENGIELQLRKNDTNIWNWGKL